MAQSKCVKCGKEISVPDISKRYICTACKVEENILTGNVNNDFIKEFHNDHYFDKKSKKFRKKFRIGALPVAVINLILAMAFYLVLCFYQQSFVALKEFLNPSFYQDIYTGYVNIFNAIFNSQQLDTVSEISIFIPGIFILYLLIPITIYNFFDLVASPYWLRKNESLKRKEIRGKFLKTLLLLPFKIYFGILKYIGTMFLLLFGVDIKNPKPVSTKSYGTNNTQYSVNSSFSSTPSSNATNEFTEEYINAAAYAYSHGGPIVIKDTHGLSSSEIQMAIANSEAYLNTLGIHPKK